MSAFRPERNSTQECTFGRGEYVSFKSYSCNGHFRPKNDQYGIFIGGINLGDAARRPEPTRQREDHSWGPSFFAGFR
jgi:hypothetical protein